MAKATFVQDGNAIDYTPSADVAAGDVIVQGDLVGVAKQPIAADALGALAVAGVFDFAKGSGAIAAGAKCYWNATSQQAVTTATGNKLIGKCILAAADGDTTVRVRMNQ